jgi:oxygen-independent coproporphyrinogen-3 oxidase
MEQDGLVKLEDDEIIVLEPGRLLVRNICMIFDRFQQTSNVTGLFSRTV